MFNCKGSFLVHAQDDVVSGRTMEQEDVTSN